MSRADEAENARRRAELAREFLITHPDGSAHMNYVDDINAHPIDPEVIYTPTGLLMNGDITTPADTTPNTSSWVDTFSSLWNSVGNTISKPTQKTEIPWHLQAVSVQNQWIDRWKLENPKYKDYEFMFRQLCENSAGTQYAWINNVISESLEAHPALDPRRASNTDLKHYYEEQVPKAGGHVLWYSVNEDHMDQVTAAREYKIVRAPNPIDYLKNLRCDAGNKIEENEFSIFALLILGVAGLIAVAHIV